VTEDGQPEPGKVLIVGPEGEEGADLDARLAAAGLQVVRVTDLDGVERAFRTSRPDSAVLDLEGEIDDELMSALTRLRADTELRHVPVIALISEQSDVGRCDIAMTERMQKPVRFENLLARVRTNVQVKRLIEYGERRSERLASVLEISRVLNSTLDSGGILYLLTRKLSEAMELGRCSFILPDLASGIGRVIACKDDPNIQSLEINLANYPEIIQVLRTGKRVVIEDVEHDPIMAGVRKFADVFRDQSIMTLPLQFQNEIVGILQIRKKSHKKGFTAREIEYCELLANGAANALKNAQLYAHIEKHNSELRQQKRELDTLSDQLQRKNDELVELQQLKEDFTAMIVHDLRSPLMIVQGVFDLLYYKHRGQPDERELIEDGVGVTKKILQMIVNLLEVSKIEAGELNLRLETIDLGQAVREAADAFKLVAQKQKVVFDVKVADGLPELPADRACLGHIIDNLLANAFKFTPDGGRVDIDVGRDGDDALRISVEDNGEGIAASDLPHIFKKFRQGRSGRRKGTGLGLTIVDLLVRAHSGRIAVTSELGEGTKLVVTLPLEAAPGR